MIKSTYQALILSIFLLLLTPIYSQQLVSADLKNHYTDEGINLWNNICGITIKLNEYISDLNSKLFQDYFLNSNLNGRWSNNWAISLQLPKDYHYDCSLQNLTEYNRDCGFEMSSNTTFFDDLGEFVWQTSNQPYWTMGFNNDHYDFWD